MWAFVTEISHISQNKSFMLAAKRAAKERLRRHSTPQKLNRSMKIKSSCHSVSSVGRRSFLRKMGIASASLAPVLALLVASSAIADNSSPSPGPSAKPTSLKWKGGIGVIPVSSVGTTGTAVANVVRGIQPAIEPWRISALSAEVKDGRIHVVGHRLLLAGGNGIGTVNGQSVFATVISGPLPNGPFTVSSTPVANAVALDADGDFTIDDVLSPTPSSDNPVLLIRNVAGTWFAAGILVVSQ